MSILSWFSKKKKTPECDHVFQRQIIKIGSNTDITAQLECTICIKCNKHDVPVFMNMRYRK